MTYIFDRIFWRSLLHTRSVPLLIFMAMLSVLLFVGCGDSPSNTTAPKPIDALDVPDDFSFRTTEQITVTHDFGTKFSNIPIAIYGSAYDSPSIDQTIPDFIVGSGTTDGDGKLLTQVSVPFSCSYLVLKPNYIGLPEEIRIARSDERSITRSFIARRGSDPEYTFDSTDFPKESSGDPIQPIDGSWWFVNDDYSDEGIPDSLFSIDLEKDFLKDVNNSLFKRNKDEESLSAELKAGLLVGTLDMSADNDVWMTFVDEKAGFNNTLGYYIYETDKKPPSIGVDDITLVFPNASYGKRKDEYLNSGDTVYIGNIAKGNSLGFVLIANGWFPGGKDKPGQVRDKGYQGIYYSEAELNPEGEAHASIIQYGGAYGDKVFLVGMEDDKHYKNDYNFNDVVFAIVVGNKDAVAPIGSHPSSTDFDNDGDGVIDSLDAYPDDAARTTKEILTGTLAYEDLWPKLGDYDFNDLVVEYEYAIDGNKDNKIVSMEMKYTILASGASLPNGLSLALPLKPSDFTVSKLTYSKAGSADTFAVVKEISEGTGSQILIFERQDWVVGGRPFNTTPDLPSDRRDPQSVTFTLTFTPAIERNVLGAVPYDVYMLVDNAKKADKPAILVKEVHLIGFAPTTLAHQDFLDESDGLKNKDHYKSERNLPWAIHIPGPWTYPLEQKSIVEGYKHFGAWAESGGEKYKDWYLVDTSAYRNSGSLYFND